MNVSKLEAFLKELCLKDGGFSLGLEISEYRLYPYETDQYAQFYNKTVFRWLSEEQRELAHKTSHMWCINIYSVPNDDYEKRQHTIVWAHDLVVLLKEFGANDSEVFTQAQEFDVLLRKITNNSARASPRLAVETGLWEYEGQGRWKKKPISTLLNDEDCVDYNDPQEWAKTANVGGAAENEMVWSVSWWLPLAMEYPTFHSDTLQSIIVDLQDLDVEAIAKIYPSISSESNLSKEEHVQE